MEPAKLAKFSAVCLLAFLIFFSSEHLNAHNKISVVPVSKKVIVDGKLDEWDLSGMIEGAFEEALKPKFTFRIAMMYDTDALYIGAHFVDDTPMVNNHDPRVRPQDGWSGDALQIRLCNDPRAQYPLPTGTMKDFDTGTVVHMTMWYYTEEKLPVLFIQYGIHQEGYRGGSKVWTGLESGVVFQKDNDGYTLEARIPWDRLNIKEPLKAGDRIAMTIQPFWGDTSGTRHLITFNELVLGKGFAFKQPEIWGQAIFLATSALPGTDNRGSILSDKPLQDSLILNFPLPDNKAKYFVVGIYNKEGLLLRSLPPVFLDKLKGEETVKVEWDGLDDDGRPLSPGDYKAKIITTSGINLRYVTSIHNAGNPPWRTDDGTGSWGGDHGPPIAAACDSKRVYLGWELSEAGTAIIAVDPHLPSGRGIATRIGRKLWGQRQIRWSTISAMAADDKNLFVAQGNVVTIFSGASGKPLNFPFGSSQLIISEAKDLSKKWAEVYKKPFWERIKNNDFGPQVTGLNLLGIAVKGDILYASLFLEDKIAIYNWKTSKKVSEINVPAPAGVAIDNNGNLIVASQNKILNIKPETKDIKVLVAKDLSAPWGVAVDRSGNIYVTDCGNSMQVKIFNREGRLLGTIGKKGGRPWVGEYDATGMLMPSGITVDNEGKIWVCEYDDTPRRVSVWSLEGNLLADLLGPGAYAVGAEADEIAPQLVNLHHTLFKVDYKTGEVTPLSTLIRPRMRGFDMFSSRGFMGSALQFRHFKGQTFAMSRGRDGVVIYKINSELIAQPVFAMGCGSFEQLNRFLIRGDPAPEDVQAQFKKASGNQLFSYWWADLNNDGLIQGKELVIKKVDSTWGLTWGSWGGWLDTDMAVWNAGSGYIWRIPVKQWLFESIPVYQDFDEQRPLFQVPGRVHSVMPDGDKVLVIHHIGGNAYATGAKWHGISCYTLTGNLLWTYRNCWVGFGLDSRPAKPGEIVGAMKFIGKVLLDNGMTIYGVNGYFGQYSLLSDEGLWVASLGKDKRYGQQADETAIWYENFNGFLFKNYEDNKVYLIGGETDGRVWEITGLDTLKKVEISFNIDERQYQNILKKFSVKAGLPESQLPLKLIFTQVPPSIDGNLDEWNMENGVVLKSDEDRQAKIILSYDKDNLYAAFFVSDNSPMKNSGKDYGLLFKTGDACDIYLGTNPDADPRRTRPDEGDIRLLFSVMEDKPVCVLYQPVSKSNQNPRIFASPVGQENFDRVVLLKEAEVSLQKLERGYILEAKVPLKSINFQPISGTLLKGDVGVIFSDEGGSINVLRSNYFNKDTAITDDIPTEVRLTPHRWGFIIIQ